MKKQNKLSKLDKISISIFISSVPKLIELWNNQNTELSFDVWLMEQYNEFQKSKKGG